MSENYFNIVPKDCLLIPNDEVSRQLSDSLKAMMGSFDEITIERSDKVQFFDAGSNFENVTCPGCYKNIDMEWWQEHMSLDFEDGGFKMNSYATPCCGSAKTLNDLIYRWEQGFGRYLIAVRNPVRDELTIEETDTLERILRGPVRVIYRHL